MIIAIDLTALSYHMTGIERYAACVSEEMIKQDSDDTYILIFRNEVHDIFKSLVDDEQIKKVILHGNNKLLFYQMVLPCALQKIEADRYLFFAFTSPILFRHNGIYNTIHDMGTWDSGESMKRMQQLYWKVTTKISARASKGIITVSEFSKGRIATILRYPDYKIQVIPSAVYKNVVNDEGVDYEEVKGKYNLPDKYIMDLSTLEPRKNLKILLKAFYEVQDKVDYDLVLVGRKGWKMDEVLEQYNSQSKIHITGFVEDNHVASIYKHAMCFVFPSLYEGFGLPPVEALSVGTPVIASDAASMPEVLRKQAVYFKNNDIDELKNLLVNLEDELPSMPRGLDDFQKENYRFDVSARKVLGFIEANNN